MNPLWRFFLRACDRLRRECDDFRVERTKVALGACGERVFLSAHAIVWSEAGLRLGDDVAIHSFTHIFAAGGVTIGSGTMISANCSISSVTHVKNSPQRHLVTSHDDPNEPLHRPVTIGDNVWIGMGAIILPGVTIGDHAIIGAGSVVTKAVPPRAVCVGNPARVVQTLPIDLPA
jgi:acetyltransferase-like isoleucine patch superfamily enzyme